MSANLDNKTKENFGLDENIIENAEEQNNKKLFDTKLITEYPNSTKKINLQISEYSILEATSAVKVQTTYASPHGFEIATIKDFATGSIIKMNIKLPDYWARKQKFVEYGRIDRPKDFTVLGRVIEIDKTQGMNRRKKMIVQLVNIDEADEKVLRSYIDERE